MSNAIYAKVMCSNISFRFISIHFGSLRSRFHLFGWGVIEGAGAILSERSRSQLNANAIEFGSPPHSNSDSQHVSVNRTGRRKKCEFNFRQQIIEWQSHRGTGAQIRCIRSFELLKSMRASVVVFGRAITPTAWIVPWIKFCGYFYTVGSFICARCIVQRLPLRARAEDMHLYRRICAARASRGEVLRERHFTLRAQLCWR